MTLVFYRPQRKDLEVILEVYWELYPENQNKSNYLFFDEIQNVKNWESAVSRLHATKKFHIFITVLLRNF